MTDLNVGFLGSGSVTSRFGTRPLYKDGSTSQVPYAQHVRLADVLALEKLAKLVVSIHYLG